MTSASAIRSISPGIPAIECRFHRCPRSLSDSGTRSAAGDCIEDDEDSFDDRVIYVFLYVIIFVIPHRISAFRTRFQLWSFVLVFFLDLVAGREFQVGFELARVPTLGTQVSMPRSQVDRGTLKNDDHEMSVGVAGVYIHNCGNMAFVVWN
jgi:hypothetical protein